MKHLFKIYICILVLNTVLFASTTLIKNTSLYISDNLEKVTNHDILFNEKEIIDIGPDLSNHPKAKQATVIDGNAYSITPGLITLYSQLGISEIGAEPITQNTKSMIYGPSFSIASSIDSKSNLISYMLSQGISTAAVHPSFSALRSDSPVFNFSGLSSVISLKNGDDKLIKTDHALIFSMHSSSSSSSQLLFLEDALIESKSRLKRLGFSESKLGFSTRDLKALYSVMKKKRPLFVFANAQNTINELINIKKKYNINLVIFGAKEAETAIQGIKKHQIPLAINPIDNIPNSFNELNAYLNTAATLSKENIQVAFINKSLDRLHLIRQFSGNAVANGMNYSMALAAITKIPAELLGLKRLGLLKKGYQADLVLWSNDPLELSSYPVKVFINGVEQSLMSRQKALKSRYLNQSKEPIQYLYE